MKAPIWTPERVKALSRSELEQLRANAARLSNSEVVATCDVELESRGTQKRVSRLNSSQVSATDVVTGYHFVCQSDRGVEMNTDGTFWSGSWIVAEQNVLNSLKYGAYLALHSSKSERSYRQGTVIDYRKAARSMVSKNEEGIEFKVRPEDAHYEWVGNGAGEKGYKWSKQSSRVAPPNQEEGN